MLLCETRMLGPRAREGADRTSASCLSRETAKLLESDAGAQSEIPRPSSRDTAKPPRWVGRRGGNGRDEPSVGEPPSQAPPAERTEAGPGPGAGCHKVGPIP